MRIVGLPRPFYYVSRRRPIEMSEAARQRLRWLNAWQRLRAEGFSAQKAADILRLPRSTLYRWKKQVEERGLIGLEDGDRRPKQVRRPQWSPELAEAVLRLREAHPGMGNTCTCDASAGEKNCGSCWIERACIHPSPQWGGS